MRLDNTQPAPAGPLPPAPQPPVEFLGQSLTGMWWVRSLVGAVPAVLIAPAGSRLMAGVVGGLASLLLTEYVANTFHLGGPGAYAAVAALGVAVGIGFRLLK